MALIIKDRVKETTTTSGTIPFVCGGAVVEFQSFGSSIGDANTTLYVAEEVGGTNWEVGVGQYVQSNNSLLRSTILSSSNNNAIVNFPAGQKNLFVTVPAAYAALTGRDLSQFATTTSANLASIISDETGSGQLVFSNNAILVNPTIGTANGTTLYLTNDLRAGNVYSNGQIVLTSEPLAQTKVLGFYQNTAPITPNTKDTWIHSDTGVQYQNVGNTSSPIWIECGPTVITPNTQPGQVSATQLIVNYTPSSTTGTSVQINSANTKGGAGYSDFLQITNTSGNAVNPNKWFRLNSSGGLEIINSAYTNGLLTLDDSGNLTISGNTTFNGVAPGYAANRPGFRVIGANTSNINATTTLTINNWAVDWQQGNYLNHTTGIFTAPVAGLYSVNLTARTQNNNYAGLSSIGVQKNGSAMVCYIEFYNNTSMNHAGSSTVVKLAVGDTLKVVVTSGQMTFDLNDNWAVAYLG